jgi:hypothetical protein
VFVLYFVADYQSNGQTDFPIEVLPEFKINEKSKANIIPNHFCCEMVQTNTAWPSDPAEQYRLCALVQGRTWCQDGIRRGLVSELILANDIPAI